MAVRKHVTLVASAAQTVQLQGAADSLELLSHGSGPVYYRFDGTTAVVQADDAHVCQAGLPAITDINLAPAATLSVSVISATAQDVSLGLI